MIWCVEDDSGIREIEVYTLNSTGFEARGFADGASFREALETETPELVLLDVMLPGEDGVSLLRYLRQLPRTREIPVIMATAKGMEYDKIQSLDMGADDYVSKPFRPRELLSRIRSVLRRSSGSSQTLALGDVEIDASCATVRKAGRDLALSALEYRLLLLFAQNPGKLVTRERLREAIWDDAGEYVSDNTLNVYIKRLRDKVEDDPAKPVLIQTVRGLGYRAQG